ncbi:3-hydroxyacyl-CoA dehydrogenase [Mortierella sp. GBAus27b]|nr:3-hydroxyacyl-CoA dehydrogenase [Mortierella sp. GBAus27b]
MTKISSFSTSSSSSSSNAPVKNITVFGSGLMGAGIVQVAAQNAFNVTMVDLNPEALKKGQDIITSSLKRVAKKQFPEDDGKQKEFIDKVMAQIKTSTDSEAASKEADLIVEAIVENLKTKQQLFSMLDKVAPKHTLFCSNTSSLPIQEIAKATQRGDRFGGLHFFNPVPQMKLVEVIRTSETSQDSFDSLMDVCTRMKKTPVSCKDTPGFIVNRLLVPYMMEALRIVERQEATPQDVDTAMKLGAGFPMGPFELADFVGLDTMKFIVDGWRKDGKIDANLVAPVKLLDDLVAQGNLGRKSGQGFYPYSGVAGKK